MKLAKTRQALSRSWSGAKATGAAARRNWPLLALSAGLAVAGGVAAWPQTPYRLARFLEESGRWTSALKAYEKAIAKAPEGPKAAEMRVRAGELYARKFRRCGEAVRHFEAAARLSPPEPWAQRARAGIMDCPDYFPLQKGRTWVYGDTQSGGKFMRLERELREAAGGERGTVLSSMFAGNRRLRVDRAVYEKKDWMVFEGSEGGPSAPILRYPYRVGSTWEARRGGERLKYRIEAEGQTVKTAAGTFENCLKVREVNASLPNSYKYDYYAPFVGRVKTTVGGPGFENPNTELLKYSDG